MKTPNSQEHRSRYKDIYELRSAKTQKNEILHLRKTSGLHVIKSGTRPCLKCDRPFESEDLTAIRLCYNCKYGHEAL